ncbi:MAG: hypothetical protein E7266_08805 [Lachnospiraceae bacterium]|nr:hypothetical protein [Lachnospiraceae bacterium]
MKSQVNFVYDFENDPVDEVKHWLFLESVRIEQDRQELDEQIKKLQQEKEEFEKYQEKQKELIKEKIRKIDREKELFDKQWKVIEKELKRIAKDNERIANEKEYLEREKRNFRKSFKDHGSNSGHKSAVTATVGDAEGFFVGTTGLVSVRKRYKELMKIYHPDNVNGESPILVRINKEYEELVKRYKG